jgi:hypothetical protein
MAQVTDLLKVRQIFVEQQRLQILDLERHVTFLQEEAAL